MDLKGARAGHETLGLGDDDLLRMYRCMLLARRVDERMWILNRQGKAAFVISCQGHEAAQVGAAYNLRPGYDYVYPYYRDAGIALSLGQTARDQFLSLLARKEDPNSAGRQMPGHYSSRELNIVTASAPVGVQYPQATGTALAFKMRGEDGVVLVCGGEASTSGGDWHEAMNFAGIHDLPVVFLVENNLYAISVPAKVQVAGSIAGRAEGYGFPGIEVDGNDLLAVYEAAKEAFERARAGEGPTLIEAKTYRLTAHSSDDDDRRYREREEIEEWRRKDPIARFEKYLEEAGLLDEEKKEEMAARVKAEVDEAVEYAEAAPYADPEEALERVYAEGWRMATKNLLQAIHDGLGEEMRADDAVMVLGEDVGKAGGVFRVTQGLADEFGPLRAMDTPLAESLIVGAAIGLSVNGMRPVAEIQFADFIFPAFDQIVNEAARFYYRSNGAWNCPMTIRIPYGAVPGGALYHSQSVEACFCNTPGLKIVAPTFPADAKGMLKSAIRDPNPVLFFEHKRAYRLIKEDVPEDDYSVPLDKARVHREGTDLTVVSYGMMLHAALEVAGKLAEEHGIEAEIVEPRTLYPLDRETILDSARKTGKVLVVSEANLTGSVSGEIAAVVVREAFEWLDGPVMRLGAPDVPAAAFAKPMMEFFVPSAEKIETVMLELARY